MIEFTLVLIAVVAVIATNWESASRWQMRVGGLLSFALGVRVAALVTATYLLPCFASLLLADEPVAAASTDATAQVKAESTAEAAVEPPAKLAEAPEDAASTPAAKTPAISPATSPTATSPATASSGSESADSVVTNPSPRPSEPIVQKEGRTTVAYITNVKYLTPNRPSWIESAPTYDGELYKVSIKAGPYRTIRDCEPDLQKEALKAVEEFTNDHLRAPHAALFINYSLKDLRTRKVVREQFSEQLETSLGLMNQVHAQLVFDDQFRNELDQRWSEIKSKSRLAQTGLGAGIVLLFLGTMFSFLKLDTVTRGYYTGRLQFGAAATILALVAASVLLMKWIPWM